MEVLVEISPGKFEWKPVMGTKGGVPSFRSIQGTGEQNRNRYLELPADGSVLSAHWPAGAGISDLAFLAGTVKGVVALTGEEYALVAIDSVNLSAANAELTETSDPVADVQWHKVYLKELAEVPQSGLISNGPLGGGIIYAKAVGGIAMSLMVGAS